MLHGCIDLPVDRGLLQSQFLSDLAQRAWGYIPVAISMVREVTPPHLTNTALAAVSAALGVGGALGLPIAALIVQSMDWRALFWLSGVLAIMVIALSAAVLSHQHRDDPANIHVIGAIGLTMGLVTVLVGVTKGNDWGWSSPATLSMIICGGLILIAWGFYEVHHKEPIVDLRTTARLRILLTNLAALMAGFGMMAPAGMMMLVMSPVSSALLTRLGGQLTLALGGGVLAAGYLLPIFMTDAPWKLMIATSVACAGVGIAYAAMPALILNNVPRDEASSSVGVNALMRFIGTTLSGAVMAIALTSQAVPTDDGIPAPPGTGESLIRVARRQSFLLELSCFLYRLTGADLLYETIHLALANPSGLLVKLPR